MTQSPSNDLHDRHQTAVREAQRLREELSVARERHRLLVREHSYRVASNLQLLAANLFHFRERAGNPAIRDFAAKVIVQIQAVARVHTRLTTTAGEIDLASFVREVCTDLSIISGLPNIRLEFDTDPLTINADQAAPIGLIATELVSNAYRHAFSRQREGSIRLHLKPVSPVTSMLAVADSGRGMRPNLVKGAGLTTVEMLARSIGGDVSYGRGPGARVNIAFPNLIAANRILDL
jgi:two-component system, sensor histidine kinase PdtaS